ncbi:hypothetical protein LINGRAHAP2_LOCUS10425 [Linum grandiflorum]
MSNPNSPSSSDDNTISNPPSPLHLSLATTAATPNISSLGGQEEGGVPLVSSQQAATEMLPVQASSSGDGVGVGSEGAARGIPSSSTPSVALSLSPSSSAAAGATPTTGCPLMDHQKSVTTATSLLEEALQRRPPPQAQHNNNKRQKGEMDEPTGPPACPTCKKMFRSWKGVFGHLRMHKERPYRGAFPPPVSFDTGSTSQHPVTGTSTGTTTPSTSTTTPRRGGLVIDLNIEFNPDDDVDVDVDDNDNDDMDVHVEHEQAPTPPPPPPRQSALDLNEPAKSADKDGESSTSNNKPNKEQ